MKRVKSIVAGSLFSVLIVCGGCSPKIRAQFAPGEVFTVPFAFRADGHEIGAGTYEIRRDSSQFLISIQNVQTGEKQLFSVRPEERSAVPSKGLLVFHGCGEQKELSEFHIRGTRLYSATIDERGKSNTDVERCSANWTTTIAAR